MKIEVKPLTRVEGHVHLVVDGAGGELRECRLEVVESPRFFDGLLKGRHFSEVAPLVARICGICSNAHTLVSLEATERALGVAVGDQTRALRRLLAYGEILQSHILHLYFMALPDYLGVASIFPLAKSRRETVMRALRLKKLANDICETVGGRPVHPVTPQVGGFAALPETSALQQLRRRLVAALPDLEETVDLFATFSIPEFSRETDHLCLEGTEAYPLLGDRMAFSGGPALPVADYAAAIEEYQPPRSTAKFARSNGRSYMVGPLARTRSAYRRLSPMAKKVAEALVLLPDTANPFRMLAARLVEVVHGVEESLHLIDRLLSAGWKEEPLPRPRGGGRGVAAIEAPRGLLLHAYTYDDNGCIEQADCIIPTAQNLGNIEEDLRALLPTLGGLSREELTRRLEMLVRAYDPCISCSTHLLTVEFAG